MDAITNAVNAIKFAVVLEIKSANKSMTIGPLNSRPNLTGYSASLCNLRYHTKIISAIGSSFNF